MENMMQSLAQSVIDNAQAKLGIPPGAVRLILYPQDPGEEKDDGGHRQTVTIRQLRTRPSTDDETFDNASSVWPGEVEWFLTVFEVVVTSRQSPESRRAGEDYFPNEARFLAEKVRAFFRGPRGAGRLVDRIAWDKEGAPAEGLGAVVWQRTDPQPQLPGDPTHTLVLTFEMTWWAPAPADA